MNPPEAATAPPSVPRSPAPPVSAGLAILNWMLPGAGYCAVGRWTRGILQAAMVVATAAIGWSLHGGVAWPSWRPDAVDFNLINNLTFMVQLGGGLPMFASLAANLSGNAVIGGIAKAPYYELGSYYLVVAGAVNYFASLNFYDRMVRREGRYREQESELMADSL